MSRRPLRILYLAPCRPDAQSYGLQQRTLHISRALERLGTVDITVVGFADQFRAANSGGGKFGKLDFIELLEGPRRGLKGSLQLWSDPRVCNPHGQVVDSAARERLLEGLSDYDLIWSHHLRTINVFERWHWPKSVLDIDDLPSNFWRTTLSSSRNAKERFKARLQMLAWKRRERLLGERFNVLTVCSEEDKRHLPDNVPAHVIPNGFDRPAQEPQRRMSAPPKIGFIGPFAYEPNLLAIQWFVKECWPQIKRSFPDARLRLVGKGTDGNQKPGGQDIDGLGWIPDTAQEIGSWNAMIVPLHVGGGTRLKIAEGISRKCPIVSTTLGAYGYGMVSGRELLLADDPKSFADGCVELIVSPEKGAALAERAWRRFLEKWTWEIIEPRIVAAAEDCLKRAAESYERNRGSELQLMPESYQTREN